MHENGENFSQKIKKKKKPTKERLKNIGLYYLQRFDSSVENLKTVLKKRVDGYAYENKDYDRQEAYVWIDEIASSFEDVGYVNDRRYAEFKVKSYLSAGKSGRYIAQKLKQKGIEEEAVAEILNDEEYDAFEVALKLALKKKIGPYRVDNRQEFRQKDMAYLVRAGFDYDIVQRVCEYETS